MEHAVKVIVISDTHGYHHQLTNYIEKEGDINIIIHCGDICARSTDDEVEDFIEWFGSLKNCKHKVFIAGNHDFPLEYTHNFKLPKDVYYLEDSGIELEGLKLWGTPITPIFYNWAFMGDDEKQREHFNKIPEGLDILITHGPPYKILDYTDGGCHAGSKELKKRIGEVQPKVCVFGHIHEGNDHVPKHSTTYRADGTTVSWGSMYQNRVGNTDCYNTSVLDSRYVLRPYPIDNILHFKKK